jgi:hypothetical protein
MAHPSYRALRRHVFRIVQAHKEENASIIPWRSCTFLIHQEAKVPELWGCIAEK